MENEKKEAGTLTAPQGQLAKLREIRDLMWRAASMYDAKNDKVSNQEFLEQFFAQELTELTSEEQRKAAEEVMQGINQGNRDHEDINRYCKAGGHKEKWVADKVSAAGAGMADADFFQYLNRIDETLYESNANMYRTITTNAGEISQNPNLHGFIAETHHANTFNQQAALQNKNYHAYVHEPNGKGYAKGSVDVSVKNLDTGKIQNYQAKYGKNAKETTRLLKNGKYYNSRYLVGKGQAEEVSKNIPSKTTTDKLEYNGTQSKPLSVKQAKGMQKQAQEKGTFKKATWNSAYTNRELALNIGKQAAFAGASAAVIAAGISLMAKAIQGEDVDASEVFETALNTGTTVGAQTVVGGTLKAAVEKNLISIPMLSTGAGSFAIGIIAVSVVDVAKTCYEVGKGNMSITQGLDRIGRSVSATIGGICGSMAASTLVAGAFAVTGVVAGVVGLGVGIVGAVAGSKVGSAIYSGVKAVRHAAVSVVKTAGKALYNVGKAAFHAVGSVASSVGHAFSSAVDFLFG